MASPSHIRSSASDVPGFSLYRSLIFWLGFICHVFAIWALSDSTRQRSSVGWHIGGAESLLLEQVDLRVNLWHFHYPGGPMYAAKPEFSRREYEGKQADNSWLRFDVPFSAAFRHQHVEAPDGVSYIRGWSVAWWAILLAMFALWVVALYWRYRRFRKSTLTPPE